MVQPPVLFARDSKRIAGAPEAFRTDVLSAICTLLDAIVISMATKLAAAERAMLLDS